MGPRIGLAFAILALLLGGCGGGSHDASTGKNTT